LIPLIFAFILGLYSTFLSHGLKYYKDHYAGSSIPKHKLDQDTVKFLNLYCKRHFIDKTNSPWVINELQQLRKNVNISLVLKK
jgi:hypothetical protein